MQTSLVSIVICSRKKSIDKSLLHNISATIGTEFEIVWIDNSENKFSMCQAYNEGVRKAKGEYLCFMHEDISFLSENWGNECISEINRNGVWMLGVLGTRYLDTSTIYWCFSGWEVGHNYSKDGKNRIFGNQTETQDVVAIDGLWMFTKKELFHSMLWWDEETFHGFDMYDMDLCMQITKMGGQIKIIGDIDIMHYSDGNFTPSFYNYCLLFHEKWDYMLPVSSMPLTKAVIDKANSISLQYRIELAKEFFYLKQSRVHSIANAIISIKNRLIKVFRKNVSLYH